MMSMASKHFVTCAGFTFEPNDSALVSFYVSGKVSGRLPAGVPIKDVDIYRYNPDQLPPMIFPTGKKNWFYYFVHLAEDNEERRTPDGCWKLVESSEVHKQDSYLEEDEEEENLKEIVGLKKTYVFCTNEVGPDGKCETNWKMEEFQAHLENPVDPKMKNWVLCRIRYEESRAARRKKRIMIDVNGKS